MKVLYLRYICMWCNGTLGYIHTNLRSYVYSSRMPMVYLYVQNCQNSNGQNFSRVPNFALDTALGMYALYSTQSSRLWTFIKLKLPYTVAHEHFFKMKSSFPKCLFIFLNFECEHYFQCLFLKMAPNSAQVHTLGLTMCVDTIKLLVP